MGELAPHISLLVLFLTPFLSAEICSFSLIIESLIFLFHTSHTLQGVWMKIDNLNLLLISLSLWLGAFLSMGLISLWLKNLILSLIMVICTFFLTESLMAFFICYELSLVPLVIILICWGAQAERLMACQFMFLYTIIFSSPLLLVTLLGLSVNKSMAVLSLLGCVPSGTLAVFLSAFLVKAPLFILHSWLPKAHVESPLEGSIILAGIMLKFGVYGLIRFNTMFFIPPMLKNWMFFFSVCGAIVSACLALSSDDMKMSVAYSSVSHMNLLICSIFTEKLTIIKGAVATMVGHGVSSPLLFLLVTKIYSTSHTRSILLSKGAGSKALLLSIFGFIMWSVNFSVPPSLSFIGEVSMISSILSLSPMSGILVGGYIMSISFFSILNFGTIFHSPHKSSYHFSHSGGMSSSLFLLWGSALMGFFFFFLEDFWM